MAHRRINISLEEELAQELDSIARELGEKKSHIVREALMHYFDYLDVKIAEKRLKELEEGRSETIPAEEVFRKAGLE